MTTAVQPTNAPRIVAAAPNALCVPAYGGDAPHRRVPQLPIDGRYQRLALGPYDPEGFAAMGVAETLLHTYDITQGLSVHWLPPVPLSAAVLDRLFPAAPPGDPTQVLLWCTGCGELDGLPRQTSWRWEAARPD
ncbi:hypothetical protein GCM10010103_76570 [Streptomyces paradoxus]